MSFVHFLTYSYFFILFVCSICSLGVSFRLHLPFQLKFFAFLLTLTFVVELLAYFSSYFPHTFSKNNFWVYNYFTLIEYPAYAYFFKQLISSKKIKKFLSAYIILFPLLGAYSLFYIFGISNWNSYVIIAGDLFTVIFSIVYLFQLTEIDEPLEIRYRSEAWIAIGMILFYSFQIPFLGTFNYLIKNYMDLALHIYPFVQFILILMYCLFIYAYLCRINIKKYSSE